jgi:hypothetical protein
MMRVQRELAHKYGREYLARVSREGSMETLEGT